MSRLLVIGLDGATLDVIEPMVREGKLPNIARFMEEGSYGPLRSTIPLLSPVAWTTFSTGVSPAGHGIFDFLCRKAGTYDLYYASSAHREFKPFWVDLGEQKRKAVVMGIPATFPPDALNGVMAAGEPAPFKSPERVFPPSLYEEIVSNLGDEVFKVFTKKKNVSIDTFSTILKRNYELAKFLLKKTPDWDLGVIVFTITDIVQHFFWKDFDRSHPGHADSDGPDPVRRIYAMADEVIGELAELAGDSTDLMIMSDHGFSPLVETFSVTKWLVDEGYLRFEDKGQIKEFGEIASGGMRLLKSILGHGGPPEINLSGIDWSRTRVYFVGVAGSIFVNLKGREPEGIVSKEEYEPLLDEISAKLKALKGSKGDGIIKEVHKVSEIYPSTRGNFAPDLFVEWNRGFNISREGCPSKNAVRSVGKLLDMIKPPMWSGTHHRDGIVMLKGPSVKKWGLKGAAIADLAPTIYYLMDATLPQGMDGKILKESVRDEILESRPVRLGSAGAEQSKPGGEQSEDDLDYVKKSLRGLGYLE